MDEQDFRAMVAQMYGNEEAARRAAWDQFIELFEPVVTVAVRLQMRFLSPYLRVQRDTADGVQSVFAHIMQDPEYRREYLENNTYQGARNLIATMTRNRLLQFVRRQRAQCRDASRNTRIDEEWSLADTHPNDPAQLAMTADEMAHLNAAILQACNNDENTAAMVRALLDGETYRTVAERSGWGSPDAVRMFFYAVRTRLQTILGIES